jgi:DnaJ-class molecular chaperone
MKTIESMFRNILERNGLATKPCKRCNGKGHTWAWNCGKEEVKGKCRACDGTGNKTYRIL